MDNQTSLLVSSVVINILLIIERFMKRITKSECFGTKLELERSKSTNNIQELNLNNIKVDNNESVQTNDIK